MQRSYLLIVTAITEAGTGLLLLVSPSLVLRLLLGMDQYLDETVIVARIAGAALVAIGVGCWIGRNDFWNPTQFGILISVLVYDIAAALLLAYAGAILASPGVALWPAVILHVVLALWCGICIWKKPQEKRHG